MKKILPFLLLIWVLTDIYFYQVLKTLELYGAILSTYWIIELSLLIGIAILIQLRKINQLPGKLVSYFMALVLLSIIPKLFALPVLLLEDISRLFRNFPPRSSWVSELALLVALFPFFSLIYGMTDGRHRYKVHKVTLNFDDLPIAFDGFTITQLSDIHAGSFTSKKGVEKGIGLVNSQHSDLILFTGDLVNNEASEMDPWIPCFSKLNAPYGKYAVLGNHDYGDYEKWDNENLKSDNLNRMKQVHQQIGFRLLLDEAITIEKQGQPIALIGVENWGKGGFHKYGNLSEAAKTVENDTFKILMSHDPSHWEAKTLLDSKHIHLTLAGHTHGMQFGIELFGFQWSPVKYMYPQWAGLYKQQNKYLYVNRGFGFIGFKGRLGIWPEITVITLKCNNQNRHL